jgi:hypothetical protein
MYLESHVLSLEKEYQDNSMTDYHSELVETMLSWEPRQRCVLVPSLAYSIMEEPSNFTLSFH